MQDDKITLLVTVAKAYYLQGASQQEIADSLHISRSQISRYLAEALKLGIVKITIVDEDERIEVLKQQLTKKYPCLKDLIILPFGDDKMEIIDQIIAKNVAQYVSAHLEDNDVIGTGSGRCVLQVVKFLQKTNKKIRVNQLLGSTGSPENEVDFSEIAIISAKNLGCSVTTINAPTVLWKNTTTTVQLLEKNQVLKKAVIQSQNCNIYLVGIGSLDHTQEYLKSGMLDVAELAVAKVEGAVGNICASFFDKYGNILELPFSNRIVGVRIEDIKKARLSILVVSGKSKVSATMAVLTGGYINVLATNYDTAKLLL